MKNETYKYQTNCSNCGAKHQHEQKRGKQRPVYKECETCGREAHTDTINRGWS